MDPVGTKEDVQELADCLDLSFFPEALRGLAAQAFLEGDAAGFLVNADRILAYVRERLTNGIVEGINNKLRMIAPRAYG